ncbi:MAG: TolC family protein [Gemmatimonadota bacterium]
MRLIAALVLCALAAGGTDSAAAQQPDTAGAAAGGAAVAPRDLAPAPGEPATRLAVGAPAPAPGAIPLSLEQAEELALERNERVLIAREEIERTKGLEREVRAASLPSLDVIYRYTRNVQRPVIFFDQGGEVQQVSIGEDNDNTVGLSLDQTLFSRSVLAANRAAGLAQEVSELGLEEVNEELALDVRRTYYTVLLNAALIGVQELALEQADARLGQVRQFFDVGTAAEFDVLTAEVEADNIRPLLITARNDYALALNELKRVVGLPLDEPVALTDSLTFDPVEMSFAQALELARLQRDDLRRQRATVQLQQQAVAVERAQAFPELSFNFDLTRRASSGDLVPATSDFSQSASAGVELSFPVFDGRATEGRMRQARAVLAQEELRQSALEEDVALEVQQALQNVRAASEATEAARATVSRAARALEIAQTRFRNGLSTQLELNDSELALTQARSTLARTLYQHNVARAELQRAIGQR